MSAIKVSVCCIAYNHVKYIERALDSVLQQSINFPIEIIIGDDCSTDGTQSIIKEYAKKYPSLIKTILQPVNSKGKKNFRDVFAEAKGEYLVVLETDDYWTDNSKLQTQADFLDQHKEFIAVAHNCVVVDENNNILSKKYPSIKQGVYSFKHFRNGLLPGQTTTLMYRNFKFLPDVNMSLYYEQIPGPGDLKKVFSLLANGSIYTLRNSMSAYRYVNSGSSSFSSSHRRDDIKALRYYESFQRYSRQFKSKEMRLSADSVLIQTALGAFKQKKIDYSSLRTYYISCNHPFKSLVIALKNITIQKFNFLYSHIFNKNKK